MRSLSGLRVISHTTLALDNKNSRFPPWVGYMLAAMLRKENITNPQSDHAINPVRPEVHFKYSI